MDCQIFKCVRSAKDAFPTHLPVIDVFGRTCSMPFSRGNSILPAHYCDKNHHPYTESVKKFPQDL